MEERVKEYETGRLKRLIDQVKKERQGRLFKYGEISDDVVSKRYFPLGRHLWHIYRELGYEHFIKEFLPEVSDEAIYDVFKIRLDEAIQAARDVISGKNPYPEKSVGWSIFPPVAPLRGDLAQGTMKLMYGESLDVSFIVILDTTNQIFFILNGHCESYLIIQNRMIEDFRVNSTALPSLGGYWIKISSTDQLITKLKGEFYHSFLNDDFICFPHFVIKNYFQGNDEIVYYN